MDEKNEAKVCFETIKSTLDGMKWNYDVKEDFLIATSANGDNMAIPLFIGIEAGNLRSFANALQGECGQRGQNCPCRVRSQLQHAYRIV